YVIMENFANKSIRSIFHSADGGNQWAACTVPPNLGTQAWSDLCIAVHPDDPLVVIVGNLNLARTVDGGTTANWPVIMDWTNFTIIDRAQHGDQHTLMFDLREHNRIWVGNDGGISSAPDVVNVNPVVTRTWRKRSNGLCVSQFNDITSHPNYPFMMG